MLGELSLETARNASLWGVVGLVVVALLAVWIVKQVVTKVLSVIILLVLAGLLWSQRVELNDCVGEVKATVASNLVDDTTCTFFGRSVTVPGLRSQLPDPTSTTTTP